MFGRILAEKGDSKGHKIQYPSNEYRNPSNESIDIHPVTSSVLK